MARSIIIRLAVEDGYSGALTKYNQQMAEAERNTKAAGGSGKEAAGKWDQLTTAAAGFISVGLAFKVAEIGLELNRLGRDVNAQGVLFNQLAGGAGNASALMDELRAATGYVVDDMTLMQGASQLMNLGIADSNEQVVDLIDLITALKKPTDSASDAVNNFSLMLANQSYLRLDSFGLASGRVRERVNELKDSFSDMTTEQAFTQAVMEQMAEKVQALGPAAHVSETALGRLETRFANLTQQAGSNINQGVEGLIGITEIALGLNPQQQANAEMQARRLAENTAYAVQSALADSSATAGLPSDFVTAWVTESVKAAENGFDPAQIGIDSFRQRIMSGLVGSGAEFASLGDIDLNSPEMQAALDNLGVYALELAQTNDQLRERARLEEEAALAADLAAQQAAQAEADRQAQIAETQRRNFASLLENTQGEALGNIFGAAFEQFAEIPAFQPGFEMPEFMTREQADRIAQIADNAKDTAEKMKEMDKASDDTFSDDQLQRSTQIADEAGRLAKEAQQAADAFEKIKLSELFGQTGGGTLGEITDAVLEQMKTGGATDEQIAAAQREFQLASGQATASSLLFEEQIAPMIAGIAAESGPALAAEMAAQLDKALKDAVLAGVDVNSADFLAALQQQFATPEGAAAFDPTAFVTDFTEAQQPVADMAADTTTISTDITETAEAMPDLAADTATMSDNFATAEGYVGKVRDALREIGVTVTRVRLKPEWVDVDGLFNMLLGRLVNSVQSNGGAVPGASSGASLSASV